MYLKADSLLTIENFQGGINFLNTNFAKELREVQMELDASKMNIKLKLEGI